MASGSFFAHPINKLIHTSTLAAFALAAPLAAFRPAARVRVESQTQWAAAPAQASVTRDSDTQSPPVEQATEHVTGLSESAHSLEALMSRVGSLSPSTLRVGSAIPALARLRADTEPPKYVDLETLIEVTKAAKRMTSDSEKGQLLALIAKGHQRSDALRDAYLDAVFTMTSDMERGNALLALLDRDSLPLSAVAQVLKGTAMMTSDMNKGLVLRRISPAAFADSAVQRAYLDAIVAMRSDTERGSALATLVKQRSLAQLRGQRADQVFRVETREGALLVDRARDAPRRDRPARPTGDPRACGVRRPHRATHATGPGSRERAHRGARARRRRCAGDR